MKPIKLISRFHGFKLEPEDASSRRVAFVGWKPPLLGNQNDYQRIQKVFEQAKPVETISEYEKEQQAMRANLERLKAERLAIGAAASK
jgi:hypothetical protein